MASRRTATEAEMKSAFRKLAMKYHPDKNPGDHEAEVKFKEINEAYQTLQDPQKRAAYDRFGHAAFANGGGGGGPGFGNDFSDFMSDIFENFFGDGRAGAAEARAGASAAPTCATTWRSRSKRPSRARTPTIKIPTSVTCEVCSGSGAKAGSKPKACPTCGGYGRVRATQGFFSIERTCPNCHGRGEIIDDPCAGCGGAGRVTRERTLSVNVPAGRRGRHPHPPLGRGRGGSARRAGGRPLHLPVAQTAYLLPARRGGPVLPRAHLHGHGCARRRDVTVPTIDGSDAKVKIPEGTQSGKQFRLKGKGMPVLRSRDVGDLYIQVVVETPQNLTKRQRELLLEFERECSKETHPESSGFFSRVREFFDGLGGSH